MGTGAILIPFMQLQILPNFFPKKYGDGQMPVRPVLRMGNPQLFKKSDPVEKFNSPELDSLIIDLQDTMKAMYGAGIAAPQIGVLQRVVIFGFDSNTRYPNEDAVPFTVLVNPRIEFLTDARVYGLEGCLSVPGMRGVVPRCQKIRYSGFDQYGNPIDRTVSDFHARVVQHECDHLDGILYPMRIEDFKSFGFVEELGLA